MKGIIFSAPMVRALGEGRKTQHRVRLKPHDEGEGLWYLRFPYLPGERLYVKEVYAVHGCAEKRKYAPGEGHPWGSPIYRATFGAGLKPVCEGFTPWRSPAVMPEWASRYHIEVVSVEPQRIQEISEADAEAEGVEPNCVASKPSECLACRDCNVCEAEGEWMRYGVGPDDAIEPCYSARDSFRTLINSLHPGTWERNEWFCRISFRKVKNET